MAVTVEWLEDFLWQKSVGRTRYFISGRIGELIQTAMDAAEITRDYPHEHSRLYIAVEKITFAAEDLERFIAKERVERVKDLQHVESYRAELAAQ